MHSSSGRYGADRQLPLLVCGLDPDRYRPIVVLPPGELARDLRAAGAEVIERSPAVIRPRRGRLIRRREVALVHSNTSVVLSGAAAAAAAGVPHVWHVPALYSRYPALWPT